MEPKAKRTAPAAERRAQIIEAARRCFIRTGFALTKIADIAQVAGVSVGLIYRHFPDKDALIAAIVQAEAHSQVGALLGPIEQRGADARIGAAELVDLLRRTLHDRNRVQLMLEVTSAMLRDERLKRTAATVQLEQSHALARELVPRLNFDVDVEALDKRLQLLAALTTGIAIQIAIAPENKAQLTQLFDESAGAILFGRLK